MSPHRLGVNLWPVLDSHAGAVAALATIDGVQVLAFVLKWIGGAGNAGVGGFFRRVGHAAARNDFRCPPISSWQMSLDLPRQL